MNATRSYPCLTGARTPSGVRECMDRFASGRSPLARATSRGFRQRGFSLVDTVIATAVSVVTMGSVAIFSLAMVRSHSESVRLTQFEFWLRDAVTQVERDVRLVASQPSAVDVQGSEAIRVSPSGDCMVLRVAARSRIDPAPRAPMWRGYRLASGDDGVGVLQTTVGETLPGCEDPTGWRAMSDPAQVDVQALAFRLDEFTPAFDITGLHPRTRVLEMRLEVDHAALEQPWIQYKRVRVRADTPRPGAQP